MKIALPEHLIARLIAYLKDSDDNMARLLLEEIQTRAQRVTVESSEPDL